MWTQRLVFSIVRASVGSLPCVDSLVLLQVRLLVETLPTVGTFVGPLSGMDHLMLEQAGAQREALPTVGAFVGPLPSVDPLMLRVIGPLTETLPADRARVRFLSCVGSLMADEHRALGEAFPTFGAFIGSLCCADSLQAKKLLGTFFICGVSLCLPFLPPFPSLAMASLSLLTSLGHLLQFCPHSLFLLGVALLDLETCWERNRILLGLVKNLMGRK